MPWSSSPRLSLITDTKLGRWTTSPGTVSGRTGGGDDAVVEWGTCMAYEIAAKSHVGGAAVAASSMAHARRQAWSPCSTAPPLLLDCLGTIAAAAAVLGKQSERDVRVQPAVLVGTMFADPPVAVKSYGGDATPAARQASSRTGGAAQALSTSGILGSRNAAFGAGAAATTPLAGTSGKPRQVPNSLAAARARRAASRKGTRAATAAAAACMPPLWSC